MRTARPLGLEFWVAGIHPGDACLPRSDLSRPLPETMIRYRFGAPLAGSKGAERRAVAKRNAVGGFLAGFRTTRPRSGDSVAHDRRSSTYSFAGHQTFVFRYGWPKKATDLVRSDPQGFSRDDAMV